MALTQNQLKDVCMLDGGADQCRYLDEERDDSGKRICLCQKLSPNRKIIDDEFKDYLAELARTGKHSRDQDVPLGDHCSGYLPLRSKAQGYDVSP